jgi:glycine cleavage system pyridoxal-binding protein P
MADMVMSVTVDFSGIEKAMKRHRDQVMTAIGQALVGAAEAVMTLSKATYVPVVTGTLRSTGHVGDVAVTSAGVISIEMGYGGPAAPYASAVHDAPPDRGQGKSQYLYLPFMDVARTLDRRIRVATYPYFR